MADSERPGDSRQSVVRVPGLRRARLTAVEGTDAQPDTTAERQTPASAPRGAKGPNDQRLIEDVPPHY